jgi:hypothetical protein
VRATVGAAVCAAALAGGVQALASHGNAPGSRVGQAAPATVSVSAISFAGNVAAPQVTVNGSGFGAAAPQSWSANRTSCGQYASNGRWFGISGLRFTDTTTRFVAGSGYRHKGTCVGIVLASWSDTQIVFSFGSAYDTFMNWYAAQGDACTLDILGVPNACTVSYPT